MIIDKLENLLVSDSLILSSLIDQTTNLIPEIFALHNSPHRVIISRWIPVRI
jgi:hypothetical protein